MSSFDPTPEKNNSNQHESEEKDPGSQSTSEPQGASPQKTAHQNADELPDGSGDDSPQSHENQGQESGNQSFDAG